MSKVVERHICCDGEDCQYATVYACGDQRDKTFKQLRASSHIDGWITVGSKDYCPDCKEAIK